MGPVLPLGPPAAGPMSGGLLLLLLGLLLRARLLLALLGLVLGPAGRGGHEEGQSGKDGENRDPMRSQDRYTQLEHDNLVAEQHTG